MPTIATREDGNVIWEVVLERDAVLPGTIAKGVVRFAAKDRIETRGVIAALIATEHWQWEQRSTDSKGHSRTRTITERHELRRVPVQLLPPTTLQEGERREVALEFPIPPLGPASVDATVTGLTWELEIKLDVPKGFDSSIVVPIRVLQPTALLRAGVVRVEQFALYPAAASETDGARAELELEPMPLCVGQSFEGKLTIHTDEPMKLQEVRLELRVKARATVSSGKDEEITLWVGRLAGEGEFHGGGQTIPFQGDLPMRDLPTIELPHGRTDAQFHVILAKAWARDPHLIRDVAVCSTTEV